MNRNQTMKDKLCAFYASDYHFEMISLPYINEKLEHGKEVMIVTENNLEDTMSELLSKMNLKEDKKERILGIDWNNNDLEKLKEMNRKEETEKNMVIFIKGNKNYIKNINEDIEKIASNQEHIKVIDCYNIEEVGEDLENIMHHYTKVLNTKGESQI